MAEFQILGSLKVHCKCTLGSEGEKLSHIETVSAAPIVFSLLKVPIQLPVLDPGIFPESGGSKTSEHTVGKHRLSTYSKPSTYYF